MIDVVSTGLLWRHVLRGTRDDAALRHVGVIHRPREAEVGDHDSFHTILQQDVRRLHVAVNEPLCVCGGQPRRDLPADTQHFFQSQRARHSDSLLQRLAFQNWHDEVRKSAFLIHRLDRNDVFVHDGSS